MKNGIKKQMRKGVRKQMRNGVKKQMRKGVKKQMRKGVKKQMRKRVKKQMRKELKKQMRKGVRKQMRKGVKKKREFEILIPMRETCVHDLYLCSYVIFFAHSHVCHNFGLFASCHNSSVFPSLLKLRIKILCTRGFLQTTAEVKVKNCARETIKAKVLLQCLERHGSRLCDGGKVTLLSLWYCMSCL